MADETSGTLQEPEFCEILTDRLRLRTLQMKDVEKLLPILTCNDVMKWTSQGVVSDVEAAKRWLSVRALGDVFNFAVELRDGDGRNSTSKAIIGIAGCFRSPEIGYMIHPDYAGKGYATEAIGAVIPKLFERIPPASQGGTGLDYIEGWTDIDNRPSQKVLEKLGFKYCESTEDTYTVRSPSTLLIYRKPRPGKTLEELGLVVPEDLALRSSAPTPPVQ